MTGEFELIQWIRGVARRDRRVAVGIGDDAASLVVEPGHELVVTTDSLLEGVHFDLSAALPREVGRKAVAVSLSDLAAMAASPLAVVVGLSLTRGLGDEFVRELMGGMITIAESYHASLVGGDVTAWDAPLAISVTALGTCERGRAVRRSGARPGDAIMVTGPLGGSLDSGRHYWFQPRVSEAGALAASVDVHAMIDVSDGLAADLGHVCDESGCGARLDVEAIPVHEDARRSGGPPSPLERALGDGEDFELLFTVGAADADTLLTDPPNGVSVVRIGEITAEQALVLRSADGNEAPLRRLGWTHEF